MPDGDPIDPWATAVAEGGGVAPTKKLQAAKKDSWGGFEAGKAKPLSQEDAILPGKQGPGKKKRGGGGGGTRDQKGPTGPNLVRTRISETRSGGLVESWSNTFGWIRPFQKVNHPKAGKHGGKIYVHAKDVVGGFQVLPVGAPVEFYIFEDDAGLGAEDVNIGSDAPDSRGAKGKGDFGKWGFGWGGKFGGGFDKGMKGGKFGFFDWWGDKGSGKDFSKGNKGDAGFKGSEKGLEKGKSKGSRFDARDRADGRKGKGSSSAKGADFAQKEAPKDWNSYTGLGASKSSSGSACGSKVPGASMPGRNVATGLGDSSFASPAAAPGMGTAVSSSGLGLRCQAPCVQMGSMSNAPLPGSMSGLGMNSLGGVPFPGMLPGMGVSPGMNVGRPEFGSMPSGGINLGIFGNAQSAANSGMFGSSDGTAQPWATYNSL
eukprot:TRINITY_DN34673_c0_g1_i1.p1 TRINITY_DN34673_c0_g1~~TRINITY_DN34673_c0_g1_i1.p1  ORF type:complete len:430 (-),score=96.07 TRINITY_DN34673_c0_g1_i1:195-1484(-)